jgi:transcriptional regulator NrdR family protein
MRCPKCNSAAITTIEAVDVPWNEIYRKKKCRSCGHIFHTAEFEVEPDKRFKKEWAIYSYRYPRKHK